MIPHLVAIAGFLRGAVFELGSNDLLVGRDPSNDVVLNDPAVSRQHCRITCDQGKFRLTDNNTRNGTSINGLPGDSRLLRHGDVIRLGNSFFLFLIKENQEANTSREVRLDEGGLITVSATRIGIEQALYTIAHDLRTLIRISAKISSVKSLEVLQRELLTEIFELVPADRGAILLADGDVNNASSAFGLDRLSGSDAPIDVSRRVATQVFQEGIALMSNDVFESQQLSSESLISSKVRSLLCVPLTLLDKRIGLIYLDSQRPQAGFTEGHLQIVTAIAGFAAGPLDTARHYEWLESENRRLNVENLIAHNMIGGSQPMLDVYQFITKVATTDATVLIRGESGTGKELVAVALHRNSSRAARPFIGVNCAALTETLLESELFGHEKGAFTGAIALKKGKLEVAAGGTLFLDEIGEMAPSLQAKLLRVLQEREFERVGGTRSIKLDVRLIAATNRILEQEISLGNFRKDLYYRLNVVALTMPPLRKRTKDIPVLANYFAAKFAEKCNRRVSGFSTAAVSCLTSYDWPGNVREMENAIERAVVLGSTEQIQLEDLPDTIQDVRSSVDSDRHDYHHAVREAKKQVITKALKDAEGNGSVAARALGIHPNNLRRLVRNLGLHTPSSGH